MSWGFWKMSVVMSGAWALALPALAAQEHLDTLKRECGATLGLSASGCQCIADTAAAELNDKQQAFVAAQVTKNAGEIARTQQHLTGEEMIGAATFMTTAPSRCANK